MPEIPSGLEPSIWMASQDAYLYTQWTSLHSQLVLTRDAFTTILCMTYQFHEVQMNVGVSLNVAHLLCAI